MVRDDLSDEQLLERVVRGDTAAHEILYDRYSSAAMGLALRTTGDRAAAEDVVQEAFWRVWRRADTFRGQRGAFSSWLFGIVRNLCIDTLRRRRPQDQIAADADQWVEQLSDPAGDVPEIAALRARHQQVRAVVASLPSDQRRVIVLAFFGGMTRQEIAAATGEPLGTIHTRARLGLEKLREALRRQGFDE